MVEKRRKGTKRTYRPLTSEIRCKETTAADPQSLAARRICYWSRIHTGISEKESRKNRAAPSRFKTKQNKKIPQKPPQALLFIKPSASGFCRPQPRLLIVELGLPLWDHHMRLIFTLHSNFKFCFQSMLTSYLPKSVHEKYTLALKRDYSPSHPMWSTGAGDGWISSGWCSKAALLQAPKPNLEAQGNSATSKCFFFMTRLNDLIGLFWIRPCSMLPLWQF